MATYTLNSNNVFLRCLDMGAIEVYELDSPYIFPVKGKNWGGLGISIGPRYEYEVLKVGDKEISGTELRTLINILFNSRLIVNLEGLCFIATAGVTAAALKVEYYRLFDLFDWSKYQVNWTLNTRWARSDFVDGRPLDIVKSNSQGDSDDGKKLENEKKRHEEAIKEAELKRQEELKKKDDEIEKLKEELSKERKKQENEINELMRKHKEELSMIEKDNQELKLYSFDRSSRKSSYNIHDFYQIMVQKLQITIVASKVVFVRTKSVTTKEWPPTKGTRPTTTFVPLGAIESGFKDIDIQYTDPNIPTAFDQENWRVVRVAKVMAYPLTNGFQVYQTHIAYYDGNRYKTDAYISRNEHAEFKEVIPTPCSDEHMHCINYHEVAHILGVGVRVCLYAYPV